MGPLALGRTNGARGGMKTVGRRLIGHRWYIAEVDDQPDNEGVYHWHVKKVPLEGKAVILGNLTVFGLERGFDAARRQALEALAEEVTHRAMDPSRSDPPLPTRGP